MISSTLVIVLVTTLLFGGLMSIFAKIIGLEHEKNRTNNYSSLNMDSVMIASNFEPSKKYKEKSPNKSPGRISKYWQHID